MTTVKDGGFSMRNKQIATSHKNVIRNDIIIFIFENDG